MTDKSAFTKTEWHALTDAPLLLVTTYWPTPRPGSAMPRVVIAPDVIGRDSASGAEAVHRLPDLAPASDHRAAVMSP